MEVILVILGRGSTVTSLVLGALLERLTVYMVVIPTSTAPREIKPTTRGFIFLPLLIVTTYLR